MKIQAETNESRTMGIGGAAKAQETAQAGQKTRSDEQTQKKGDVKTIFAGDLGLGMQSDLITQKKQRAQKQALKMISDAWDIDRKFDRNIQDYNDRLAQLREEQEENLRQIDNCDARKENLRQTYGVAEDSQEQQDLELLEKEAASHTNYRREIGDWVELTEEEKERLAEIKENGLTEYQQRCMEIDGQKEHFESENDRILEESKAYYAAIRSTKQARLKNNEMVKAQKKADIVMEAAGEEVVGMLTDEATKHVDEKLEEQVEDAKKKAEEKAEQEKKADRLQERAEELEKRIDETRTKRREQEESRKEAEERSKLEEELLSGMMEAGMGGVGSTAEAQSDIKNMLHKMNLLEEDLKGSIVEAKLEAYS